MRKLIFILAALAAMACGPSKEKQVTDYINANFPRSSFAIKEMGETVPLYNPSAQLVTIAGAVADFTKGAISIEELDRIGNAFLAIINDPIGYAEAHPEQCNTTGFHVWLEMPSGMMPVVFFYDREGKKIMQSTVDLQERYYEINPSLIDF